MLEGKAIESVQNGELLSVARLAKQSARGAGSVAGDGSSVMELQHDDDGGQQGPAAAGGGGSGSGGAVVEEEGGDDDEEEDSEDCGEAMDGEAAAGSSASQLRVSALKNQLHSAASLLVPGTHDYVSSGKHFFIFVRGA